MTYPAIFRRTGVLAFAIFALCANTGSALFATSYAVIRFPVTYDESLSVNPAVWQTRVSSLPPLKTVSREEILDGIRAENWTRSGAAARRGKISGAFTGAGCVESPDPLAAFRWENFSPDDDVQLYILRPQSVVVENGAGAVQTLENDALHVSGACDIRFDFGRVCAGWLEFDAPALAGDFEASVSEYNEPAVFNAGSQSPRKTKRPVRHGDTWRLELNTELYEGVRFAWLHIKRLDGPAGISNVRLICQTKPVNYEGWFEAADPLLTRAWFTGAYTVRANLLRDYFGAILMERSDRHSWTGDAHTSQAAALVAFGNFDFVKKNLRYTATQANGILSYELYWVLSVCDYFWQTGDTSVLAEFAGNVDGKLEKAVRAFDDEKVSLRFFGWDERLGAGFENPDCDEARLCYKFLVLETLGAWRRALRAADRADDAKKYDTYETEKLKALLNETARIEAHGIHSLASVINAHFWWKFLSMEPVIPKRWEALNDRLQRVSYSPFNQYFILRALAEIGERHRALTTLDDCWGGQLRNGATTFYEVFRPSWNQVLQPNDAPVNNQCGYTSLTHPWSAGVARWLTDEIAGIKPRSPGFSEFVVTPFLTAENPWMRSRVPTPHGAIEFAFNAENGEGRLVVPNGTVAHLRIPTNWRNVNGVAWKGGPVQKYIVRAGHQEHYIELVDNAMREVPLPGGTYVFKITFDGDLKPSPPEPLVYAMEAPFVVDEKTRGDWRGVFGTAGHVLFGYDGPGKDRQKLPPTIRSVTTRLGANSQWTDGTDDTRALQPPDGDTGAARKLGVLYTRDPIPCQQTMTLDVELDGTPPQPVTVSLYCVDWDRKGRRLALEVFDLQDKRLLAPVHIVRDFENGKYITIEIDRSVRIRINQARGDNATVSALFFD